jgi:N-acyl-L-homoserine lactone synthetase
MWNARELTTDKEREAAFRLRYETFAERLKWIPTNAKGLDVDKYDLDAKLVGVYRDSELMATCRIIPYGKPWMLTEVFPYLQHPIDPDSMELSRLSLTMAPLRLRIMAFALLTYQTSKLVTCPWVYCVTTEGRARAYSYYGIKLGALAVYPQGSDSIVSLKIDVNGTDWKGIATKSLTEEYQ